MKSKFYLVAIAIFIIFSGGFIGYALVFESASGVWNYKVTVTIETPEGDVSGYAVRKISNSVSNVRLDLPESGNPAEYKGEAVVVNLGERGLVFALLDDREGSRFLRLFPEGSLFDVKGINTYKETLIPGRKATIPPDWPLGYPLIVAFKNINDPMSVQNLIDWRVQGQKHVLDDTRFSELFGEGVHLKSIEYEITDEPTSYKIGEILHWLTRNSGRYLNWESKESETPMNLHGGNFKRGEGI